MLDKFLNWFRMYEMEVTWFVIGTFSAWFFVDLGRANYTGALVDAIIVGINYIYRPKY